MAKKALELNATQPQEQLQAALTAFLSQDNDQAEREELTTKLAGLAAKGRDLEQKIARRSQAVLRISEKVGAIQAEYDKVIKKRDAVKKAAMRVSAEAAATQTELKKTEEMLGLLAVPLAGYSDADICNRVALIKGVSDLIDPGTPIGISKYRVEWTTTPISIHDKQGLPIFNFGKFQVSVQLDLTDGGRRIEVTCVGVGGNHPAGGYLHPHIKENGQCCLGNAQEMLIKQLAAMDYGQVVTTMMEFLQRYNKENPYRRLNFWVANSYDFYSCPDCNDLVCSCLRCSYCGAKTPTRKCGLCPTCCLGQHTYNLSGPEKGINGTSCYPKKLYNLKQQLMQGLTS